MLLGILSKSEHLARTESVKVGQLVYVFNMLNLRWAYFHALGQRRFLAQPTSS